MFTLCSLIISGTYCKQEKNSSTFMKILLNLSLSLHKIDIACGLLHPVFVDHVTVQEKNLTWFIPTWKIWRLLRNSIQVCSSRSACMVTMRTWIKVLHVSWTVIKICVVCHQNYVCHQNLCCVSSGSVLYVIRICVFVFHLR